MSDKKDTREQILDAAFERMAHFGYSKTTMAEIAKDCGMSAGNIYRFFSSKIDIAEAMYLRGSTRVLQTMATLVDGPGRAPDKLRILIMTGLQTTFERLNNREKILQIGDVLAQERPDLAEEELDKERAILVRIIQQGVEEGDFQPSAPPEVVAGAIQNAVMKFRFPQRFTSRNLPTLERELSAVIDIIMAGLRSNYTPET